MALSNPFQSSTQQASNQPDQPHSEIDQTIEQLGCAVMELSDGVAALATKLDPILFAADHPKEPDCDKRPERPTALSERIYTNVERIRVVSMCVRNLQERLGI